MRECPSCEGNMIVIACDNDTPQVLCSTCGTRGPENPDEIVARELWNLLPRVGETLVKHQLRIEEKLQEIANRIGIRNIFYRRKTWI